jgi:hypothetical protein
MRFLTGVLLICFTAGCSTFHSQKQENWIDLFGANDGAALAVDCDDYQSDQIKKDLQRLTLLHNEMEALDREMTSLRGRLTTGTTPYLTEHQNKDIEFLLLRFTKVRGTIHDILTYYRGCQSSNPEIHTRGAILGISAGLRLSYFDSRFAAIFFGQKRIIRLINAKHQRFEIPAGFYDRMLDNVTAPNRLELIDLAWHLFLKDLLDPESSLSKIQRTDPIYAEMISEMFRLHADTHIQTDYVIHANRLGLPDLGNQLHHSRIREMAVRMDGELRKAKYKTRGVVFKDIGRIQKPGSHLTQFSKFQVEQIKALLQPGDIVLTYTAGYMSNVFLPGIFKHGITYIGSVEDRRRAGLTDDVLKHRAISKNQSTELLKHVRVKQTEDGSRVDVVEAVSEGVIMNSLEYLLSTHINRMVIIRPRISQEERLDQLVAVLQYVGAEYDFKFDFTDDSYQCCTELIYRTINAKGSVDFSLSRTKERWVLDADGIARYSVSINPDAFDLVLLAEMSPRDGDYSAIIHTGTEGEKRLRELMTSKE